MVPTGSMVYFPSLSWRRCKNSGAAMLPLCGSSSAGCAKGSVEPRFRLRPVRLGRVTLTRRFRESTPDETSFFASGSRGRRGRGRASLLCSALFDLRHDQCASLNTPTHLARPLKTSQPGERIMVVDAGGGTVDISSYAFKSAAPLSVEETAAPDCRRGHCGILKASRC